MNRAFAAAGLAAALCAAGLAQTAAAPAAFEVASLKPAPGCDAQPGRRGFQGPTPGRITMDCTTLRDLIRWAYVVFANGPSPVFKDVQVLGAPEWINTEHYALVAKAEGNPPLTVMYAAMLPALLEDRFQLKLHHETRESSVYVLTVTKNGPKLKAPAAACIPIDFNHLPPPPAPGQPRPNFCGNRSIRNMGTSLTMESNGIGAKDLAAFLSSILDHDVVDKTGLADAFDLHLEFATDEAIMPQYTGRGGPAASADGSSPSIFTALQTQLGLKLEPSKGPVDVMVIDHVVKPSGN